MKTKTNGRLIEANVAVRRQTPQEQKRFEAALELLLTDMVRQEIASRKEDQNEKESTR